MEATAVGFRFALALVFLLAGLAKLPRRAEFETAVRNYRLVPDRVARLVGRLLPPLEIALGLLLAAGLATPALAALVAVVLIAFSTAVAINLLRGRTIDCGCFGPVAEKRITWLTVGRNLLLIAMAALVAASGSTRFSLDAVLLGSGGGPAARDAVALMFAGTLAVLAASILQETWRALRLAAVAEARRGR